ncbi:MAG: PTS sugar transporter subunit IIA [Rhodanobacteraceae bacterium]
MRFLDLLPAERIRTQVAAVDKPQLIEVLAGILAPSDDARSVGDALRARERLGSTGLGHGVAIPHGRSQTIEDARAAFVRLAQPLDWGSADGRPVDLVVALVVPAHFTDQHLELLAEFASILSDAEVTAALREAPDARALRAQLERSAAIGAATG